MVVQITQSQILKEQVELTITIEGWNFNEYIRWLILSWLSSNKKIYQN